MFRGKKSIRLLKYAAAVALVMGAVFVNLLLNEIVKPMSAPLLIAAVLVAAWQGGWGPGFLATILATVADDYFFVPRSKPIHFAAAIVARLVVFVFVSTLTSYLTAKRREALEERDRLLILEHQARTAAEDANATKDRFLAATSHELRTPLSAIIMWADILTHQELPVDSLEGIAAIRRCAETQRRLVEDLLDMARSHTGKLRMEMERHDLVAVVAGALDAARPLLAEKNIKLASLLDSSREAIVWADRTRLQQVVLNLIGNAIKFTPESGIINVSMEQTTTPPMATITVRDNGRGIDAQDLPHIFDQFWQAGNTKKLAGDGMGLGLAIARDLVKLHNGRIHAESEGQGRGAAFLVELPLASVNSAGPGSTISIQPDSHAELRARHATA